MLRVDPAGPALTPNRQEASNQAVHRGTVEHKLLDGDRAVVFADDADLILRVSGRAGAGTLDEEVPYALVVTLETPEDVRLPVYAEVSARLRLRARTRV